MICAATHADRGELEAARALADEATTILRETGSARGGTLELMPFLDLLGIRERMLQALDANPPRRDILWRSAVRLALTGDPRSAAELVAPTGHRWMEATLRLDAGEQLIGVGERAEGEAELGKALDFYRSVDASHTIAKIEALLASTQSASA